MKNKARCPVVGCANIVSEDQLEANNALAYILKRKNKNI